MNKSPEALSRLLPALLLLATLLCAVSSSHAAVWQDEHQWNDEWEARFGDWMGVRYTSNLFLEGPYADIAHDCADASYYARLLFAYENKLPFVIQDPAWVGPDSPRGEGFNSLVEEYGEDSPYAKVERFIHNRMAYFDRFPPEQRLGEFIEFVGNVVWTKALINDTYPVSIDRRWFRPGVVAVLPRREIVSEPNPFFDAESFTETVTVIAGHAQMVTDVDDKGIIHYMKSSMPAKVQGLRSTTLNSFVPSAEGGSFRYWKQPHQYDAPIEELPGYGLEQFEVEGVFEDAVQDRLAQVRESRHERIARLTGELCAQLNERIGVVVDAWRYKLKIGQVHCMNAEEYDLYSTPNRDKKLRKTIQRLTRQATGSEQGDLASLADEINAQCGQIEYLPEMKIAALDAAQNVLAGAASSDPNQAPGARWGAQAPQDLGCTIYY